MEATLKDRRKVYDMLQQLEIPVPFHVYVNRQPGQEDSNVIEEFDEVRRAIHLPVEMFIY